MLHENIDFVWILVAIAGFFLGTFSGIKAEAKYWIKHAKERRPLVRDGLIFEVKCIREELGEE